MLKNADNPPGLISEGFCSLSRFLFSMSCSVDFLLLALVFNCLLGLMELAVVAKGWLAGVLISAIGLGDTWRGVVTFRFLDGNAVEFPLCKGVE